MSERSPIAVAEALEHVIAAARPLGVEQVALSEALGGTLADDLAALADHPNVPNSALDGFACRASDTRAASADHPVRLRVVGEVPAGKAFPGEVGRDEAVAIYTGGALPKGADAIVPVEATSVEGDVAIVYAPARKEDVRARAQDIAKGQVGLQRGRRLDAAALAFAAGMGHAEVPVTRPPRVAILATGSELVQPGGSLEPGQVFDANATGIAALVRAAGAVPIVLSGVRDEMPELERALRTAGEVDLILTSGGVSMGRYDLVRDLMFSRGEVIFWKVAMKPGGPTLFGRLDGIPLLGLPGNPVSSLVVFLVFGRAFIEKALGRREPAPYRRRRTVVSNVTLASAGPKETFTRVRLATEADRTRASTTGSQNSGILRSMVEADALAVIPPHTTIAPGSPVEVLMLEPLLR